MSEFRIIEGDCLSALSRMQEQSVQTCVTSPPYWGLRDYGSEGQLGLEPTPEQYAENMVAVFREVRRVLRDDGTLWLNLGDSYGVGSLGRNDADRNIGGRGGNKKGSGNPGRQGRVTLATGLKPKDLVGIPWMVAFALRADGWYLRSDIIWAKPNPMPESVTDRPTKAHEYLFLLTKSPRYFYDADAIREELGEWSKRAMESGWTRRTKNDAPGRGSDGKINATGERGNGYGDTINPAGRNKRSVWTVATQPFPGAHFATFPPKLIEPCILAGTPPKCCGECGALWERIVERTPMVVKPAPKREAWQAEDKHVRTQTGGTMEQAPSSKTVGWRSTCDHDDDSGTPTVLDPFNGVGTTGVVALRHDRDYIGIELNPEYAQMARERIYNDAPLLNLEAA